MNKNDFEGKWKKIRSQSNGWWSLIIDSDLNEVDKAEIKFYKYVTLLQLKYGYDRQKAKDEIEKRVMEYETSLSTNTVILCGVPKPLLPVSVQTDSVKNR